MSHHSDQLIVVTGATGQQGGAVARHLLQDGWKVRALVRNPGKDAAQKLAALGAELMQGDMNDAASLQSAFRGAYGVFSVQNFWLPDVGYDGEVRQGKNVADAVKTENVRHLLFSSVGAAHRGEGQKHFTSKFEIENYIKQLGLPYTILRPVAFMDNENYQRAAISNGMFFSWGLPAEKTLQLIASDDIGAAAAVVFANPAEYMGKTIELGTEELTEAQRVAILSRVIGRPVQLVPPQWDPNKPPDPEQIAMARFFGGEAYTADIPAVRKMIPNYKSYEQFLRSGGWENLPVVEMPKGGGRWG